MRKCTSWDAERGSQGRFLSRSGAAESRTVTRLSGGGNIRGISVGSIPDWFDIEERRHAELLSAFRETFLKMFYVDVATVGAVELSVLVDSGYLKPTIQKTFPLGRISDACRHFEEKHTQGKVVITIGAPGSDDSPDELAVRAADEPSATA